MSPREKRLLNLLLVVGFILVNLAAYKLFYEKRLADARQRAVTAEANVEAARSSLEMLDLFEDEMAWLEKNEPKQGTEQEAQTRLQQLLEREAQRNNLTIKRQKLQPSVVSPGLIYHRARIEIEVNGMEMSLYRWLDRIHSPTESRAVTFMRMNPQKDDDTKIDCQIIVEQWFTPEEEGAVAT
jgi:hypothetical protein